MKKILFLLSILFAISSYAQKDVTTFLGIPIDGTKASMTQKLKLKGFAYNATAKALAGEFNGVESYITFGTNKGKVWRVCIMEKYGVRDEGDIIRKFNHLYEQFENNDKYCPSIFNDGKISSTEDISSEMSFKNKQYSAMFYQKCEFERQVWFMISEYLLNYYIVIYYDNINNQPNGSDL